MGLEQGVRDGEALAGQPGGIDQVAVNPLGRLVDELQDGAVVVGDEGLDVDAEALGCAVPSVAVTVICRASSRALRWKAALIFCSMACGLMLDLTVISLKTPLTPAR